MLDAAEHVHALRKALERSASSLATQQALVRQQQSDLEAWQAAVQGLEAALATAKAHADSAGGAAEFERLRRRCAFLEGRYEALSGNFRIHDRAKAAREADWRALHESCSRMVADMQAADQVFQPSRFWGTFLNVNLKQLRDIGLENFKLSVNQNYHNFIPADKDARLFSRLLDWARATGSLEGLFASIEDPAYLDEEGVISTPNGQIFRNGRQGLVLYRAYVALLWDYVASHDQLGLMERLSEPEAGNPIRVWHRGRLASQDIATSVSEANAICRHLRPRPAATGFLEVGAGYGRLAHVLLAAGLAGRYVIVDIPPALYISHWYLSRLFPQLRMQPYAPCAGPEEMLARLEAADVHFLLPHQISLLPGRCVDAAVAVSSLHEMLPVQANMYLAEMGRLADRLVLSKQYWSYDNPHDRITVSADDYEAPPGFDRLERSVDLVNEDFFVEALGRTG